MIGGMVSVGIITAICFLLFVGAMGKSAQIPLWVWLPDAMAGPTPVSALIHAATMVTAGVVMLTRCSYLFVQSPQALEFVAIIGIATAFVGATVALRSAGHQAGSGVFHRFAVRVYVRGVRGGKFRRRHVPRHDPRLLQSPAVSRFRGRDSLHAGRTGHEENGRTEKTHSANVADAC